MSTRLFVSGLMRKAGPFLPYLGVAVVAFLVGMNYWTIRGWLRADSPRRNYDEETSIFRKGCRLYPMDPICVADRKLPKGESLAGRGIECFVPNGSDVPPQGELNLPDECRNLGPMNIDIENLRSESYDSIPKPVVDIPGSIRPHYEATQSKLGLKSTLVTYLMVMKANNESPREVLENPEVAPLITELSVTSDDGLTADERRTVGQLISVYNAFVDMMERERNAQREKVAKECSSYKDREIIPVRCAVLNSAPPAPTRL